MANKYKKFVASAATATLVASAIVPVASADETVKFTDVKDSSEFAPYIYDLAGKKVMTGSKGAFNPGTEVSRKAAVKTLGKWLVNVHGYTVPADYNTVQRFNDLPVDHKDQELVQYAALLKDNAVFTGSNGNLNAEQTLTREQMAKVVVEAYSVVEGQDIVELVADFESSLTDISKVAASNVDYVKVFEKYGITTVDTFNPKGKIQRQHFAKFLSIAINSEALATDTASLEDAVTPALEALATAVAALPKAEDVTLETADAAKAAVEAVNTAIEAAKAAIAAAELTEEAKAAADAKVADAVTAATAVANKIAEVTKLVEVASVKGINATSFEITLPQGFTLTEADLVGKEITVAAGGAAFVATYSEKSLDKEGKAIFTLAADTKLEDAVMYTVSSNWASFTANTFVAKTAPAEIKSFEQVTTAVSATKDGDKTINAVANIQVAAKDQYGEEITLVGADVKIEGTLNGMPLSANQLSIANGVVTVTPELKVDDVLAFTLSTVDAKGKDVAKNAFTYTIVKAEASKVAKIELAAKDNKLDLKEGSTIEVSAKAINQFNSTVTADASNVAWFVNGKAVATSAVTGETLTLANQASGEYKIQAFSKEDSKISAELTVTIGAAALKELTFEDAIVDVQNNPATLVDANEKEIALSTTAYNNEELLVGTVYVNDNAAVSASDIQFDVKAVTKGLTAADIKVVAQEATTEAGKKVILVKATTTKAGKFTVTPFVGASINDEAVVKASAFNVETAVNTAVASIEMANFDAKEFKVGSNPVTEITVKNKHGEVLTAAQAGLEIKTTDDKIATATIRQGVEANGEDKTKTYLELSSKSGTLTAGTAVITVQAGAVVKAFQVDVVAAQLKSVQVADVKVAGVIAGDDEAKYNAISFLDQDGKQVNDVTTVDVKNAAGATVKATPVFTVKNAAGVEVSASDFTVALGEMSVDEKTGEVSFDAAGKDTHVQITTAKSLAKGTYTVTAAVTTDAAKKEVVSTSFQVVVDAARATNSVEIATAETKVVEGNTTEVRVTPKDQYGKISDLTNVTVTVNDKAIAADALKAVTAGSLNPALKDEAAAEIVYYAATLEDLVEGENKVVATLMNGNEKVDTASTIVTVDTTAALVNTVAIEDVTGVQNVYANEVELEAIVKDAAGEKVSVDAATLTWTIEGVKDAKGNDLKVEKTETAGEYAVTLVNEKGEASETVVLTLVDGKLGTKTDASLKGLTVDVKVAVETENFKTATTTVTIGDAAPKYTAGFAVAKMFSGKTVEGEEVKFDGAGTDLVINDASKAITLTFTGVDQYGDVFNFSDLDAATVAYDKKDLAVVVTKATDSTEATVTVEALTADGGEIYFNYNGVKVTFYVSVTGKALEVIEQASAN